MSTQEHIVDIMPSFEIWTSDMENTYLNTPNTHLSSTKEPEKYLKRAIDYSKKHPMYHQSPKYVMLCHRDSLNPSKTLDFLGVYGAYFDGNISYFKDLPNIATTPKGKYHKKRTEPESQCPELTIITYKRETLLKKLLSKFNHKTIKC